VIDNEEGGSLVASGHVYTPVSPLAEYVDHFWLHEDDAQPYERERALPTGRPALWIDLGGDGLQVAPQQHPCEMRTYPTSVLLGPSSRWHIVKAGRHIARIGVTFNPGRAAAFFAPPASELHDTHVPLDALWGDTAARELQERLLAPPTPNARFQELERALLARLGTTTQHPAVAFALRALRAAPQERTIAQVVEQIALSHRQFIALFRREVGMTPKRFCRVRRFMAVVHQTTQVDQVNWPEMAFAYGYADQPHLVREFQEFAGVSPTTYLRARDASNPTYLPYEPITVRNPIHELHVADRAGSLAIAGSNHAALMG
jgi:AraC-like DNA-binding protein